MKMSYEEHSLSFTMTLLWSSREDGAPDSCDVASYFFSSVFAPHLCSRLSYQQIGNNAKVKAAGKVCQDLQSDLALFCHNRIRSGHTDFSITERLSFKIKDGDLQVSCSHRTVLFPTSY